MTTNLKEKALNEHEAAFILGLAVQTLRNDRHLRQGCPYVKIKRSVRYLVSDIENYLMKNRIDPSKELEKDFEEATQWGGLESGTKVEKGEPLFPRIS